MWQTQSFSISEELLHKLLIVGALLLCLMVACQSPQRRLPEWRCLMIKTEPSSDGALGFLVPLWNDNLSADDVATSGLFFRGTTELGELLKVAVGNANVRPARSQELDANLTGLIAEDAEVQGVALINGARQLGAGASANKNGAKGYEFYSLIGLPNGAGILRPIIEGLNSTRLAEMDGSIFVRTWEDFRKMKKMSRAPLYVRVGPQGLDKTAIRIFYRDEVPADLLP